MPFTLSHAAVALPFLRHRRFVEPVALVIGTMVPDAGYFCPPLVFGADGHGFAPSLLAGVVLWLTVLCLGCPATGIVPPPLRVPLYRAFREMRRPPAWGLMLPSLALGVASHLLLDALTHEHGWFVDRCPALRWNGVSLPLVGGLPVFKLLQYGGSAVGIGLLLRGYLRLPAAEDAAPGHDRSLALAIGVAAGFTLAVAWSEAARFSGRRWLEVLTVRGLVVGVSASVVAIAAFSAASLLIRKYYDRRG